MCFRHQNLRYLVSFRRFSLFASDQLNARWYERHGVRWVSVARVLDQIESILGDRKEREGMSVREFIAEEKAVEKTATTS